MHVACDRLQKEQVTHTKISFTELCFGGHDLLKYVFSNVFSFVRMEIISDKCNVLTVKL